VLSREQEAIRRQRRCDSGVLCRASSAVTIAMLTDLLLSRSSQVTRADRVKLSVRQSAVCLPSNLLRLLLTVILIVQFQEDDKEIEIEINNIESSTLLALIDFAQAAVQSAASKKKAK
jgi:hypothetical protein